MQPTSIELEVCLKALEKSGVPPVNSLGRYIQLLLEWNEKINLTGAKTPEDIASKHVADVWFALQALGSMSEKVFDVGSGGGIPGILLAIMTPNLQVTLVERRQKKANALNSMVSQLDLEGRVTVLARSFEEVPHLDKQSEFWFRGFLPGPKLAMYLSERFTRADLGRLILMKGPAWPQEKLDILDQSKVRENWRQRFAEAIEIDYSLPHGLGERVLVLV
ncbi:MAG: 16S rRNA (guanine(527)-N(7))-methyltransferase RsmG [Bdellovibrionota bacterium]